MFDRILLAFTRNWALKLAALTLAILLWMAVRAGSPRAATFRNIPVQVELRDPDWRLAEPPEPQAVHVTVLGPTGELLTLAGQPPRIILLVDRVVDTVETQVVPIQWVQLPREVRQARVLSLRPDTIRLRYERMVTRSVPVAARTRGELPPGYQLSLPIGASPPRVQVRGPAGAVEPVDSVPLLPVDLGGLRSTTHVPARVDSAAMAPLTVSPQEVIVVLRVAPVEPEEEDPS